MQNKYRKTIIAGNWKMNMRSSDVKPYFVNLVSAMPKKHACDVIICPPYPLIPAAVDCAMKCHISVGAQNMSEFVSGAYTGEVSPEMLEDLKVKYVILGHSERRTYYGETDYLVNKKAQRALNVGIRPIICVGESKEERERDLTAERIAYQVKAALRGIDAGNIKKVIIAYEPIWAIGTGDTASAEQAQEVCAIIRSIIRKLYDARAARGVSILYGGSMNEKNAQELLAMNDIDGGLIGGASLKPESFAAIVAATLQE